MKQVPEVIWGIHMPKAVDDLPIEKGFVALGWEELGNIADLPKDRDAIKEKISRAYPDAKLGAIPVWAGIIYRFAHEIAAGDGVIYPSKHDRMVNLGIVEGDCSYHPKADMDALTQRRKVKWVAHLPRANFSQSALHEIGSALTLFQVSNNAEAFHSAFAGESNDTATEDDSAAEIVSEQMAENTDDYILKRLKNELTDYGFEHFVATLMEAMGYHSRVTKKSGDGGVDVIAHRDELGFEPPLIKIQCKQTFSTIGRPDVQKLDGSIVQGEFGLFVTLGGFSSDAITYEQMKPNLRLIDGKELAQLVYRHYANFLPETQRIIPLRQIYVPGPQPKLD